MLTGHRFGEYVLDVQSHSLHRGESEVHLGERAFALLRLLVENVGRVVTRRELIDAVWRDVIVTDDSLACAATECNTTEESPEPKLGKQEKEVGHESWSQENDTDDRAGSVVPRDDRIRASRG